MNESKRARLEAAGWRVGDAQEFLELSDEEAAFIEVKLALAAALRSRRKRKRLTQAQVATLVSSSQSRVAKMEAADPSVSMDLLFRSLLALGATREALAETIGTGASARGS